MILDMPIETKKIRRRRVLSLRFKLRILDRIRKGERPSQIARSLNLNDSTVRSICVNETKIRNSVGLGCPVFASHVGRCRPKILEKMEIELNDWISDCLKEGTLTNTNSIKRQALAIYKALKEKGEKPTSPEFLASAGWFDRFRKRFSLKSIKVKEENESDQEAVDCLEELQGIIVENQSLDKGKKEIKKKKLQTIFTSEPFDVAHDNRPQFADTKIEINSEQETHNKKNKVLDDSHFIDIQNLEESTFEGSQINVNIASFSLNEIKKGLDLAKQLELYILNKDPHHERSSTFKTELNKCLEPYTRIYNDMKQLKITDFFNKL